jgi:hypothetical protein
LCPQRRQALVDAAPGENSYKESFYPFNHAISMSIYIENVGVEGIDAYEYAAPHASIPHQPIKKGLPMQS